MRSEGKYIPPSQVLIPRYNLNSEIFKTLIALRLSCAQFAYLARVLGRLFNGILFKASPEQVELLETTDISRLGPFIKKITFMPTRYNWTTTLDMFREIVTSHALNRHISRDVSLSRELERFNRAKMKEYIRNHFEGKPPFSEEEIQRGYDTYISRANEVKALFDSGRLESVWTVALRRHPRADRFTIDSWKPTSDEEQLTENPGCEALARHHRGALEDSASWQAAEATGDALFTTAMGSLSAVERHMRCLTVDGLLCPDFAWVNQPKWANTNISSLEELIFSPSYDTGNWEFDQYDEAADRGAAALSSILKKCEATVEVLDIECGGDLNWPLDHDVFTLPKVRSLRFAYTHLRPRPFATCLERANNLKHLKLEFNHIGSSYVPDWRIIWDAIRNHRNRMHLEFVNVETGNGHEYDVNHHTSKGVDLKPTGESWADYPDSLTNYLSGIGTWNKSLRQWFDGERSDDENADDD